MYNKKCKSCKEEKAPEEFYEDKSYKEGRQPKCRTCVQKHRLNKKLGLLPEKFKSSTHKKCCECSEIKENNNFYADAQGSNGRAYMCKDCKDRATANWREANKDKYNSYMRQANRDYYPRGRFLRYGITKEHHDSMLIKQDHKCAICKKPNPSTKRCLAVDHDHETGKVRGLLCYGCNRLMALLDNPDLFISAVNYKYKKAA